MIPETVSGKPKRGRPRVIDDQSRAIVRFVSPDIKTERGLQNTLYRQRAIGILRGGPDPGAFRWLADFDRMRQGMPNAFRPTILAELGRVDDSEAVRRLALHICGLKPKTRAAINIIRRWRTVTLPFGDPVKLRDELIRHVNDYLKRYPGMEWADVIEAARGLLESVEASADKET